MILSCTFYVSWKSCIWLYMSSPFSTRSFNIWTWIILNPLCESFMYPELQNLPWELCVDPTTVSQRLKDEVVYKCRKCRPSLFRRSSISDYNEGSGPIAFAHKKCTVAHAHHRESSSVHTKFHWTCTVDGVCLVGHDGWSAFLHQMQCQVGVLLIGMANSTLVVDGQHLLFKYIRREWMKWKCCQLGDHKQEKIQTCDIGKKLADDMCYLCFLSFMAECLVFRPPIFHLKCEDKITWCDLGTVFKQDTLYGNQTFWIM